MNISNKVVVITGASKGIGREAALTFAQKGAKLAISARNEKLLKEVADQCPTDVLTFAGDMSDENDIINFIKATSKKFGRIDILVNNAGLGFFKPIIETSTEEWDKMFNLNVRGLFITTRETLPYLREAGESVVVNVASLAGKNTNANLGGYSASKHAVISFSRTLMIEERKNGIRVLTFCPGSVDTDFSPASEEKKAKKLKVEDVVSSIIHMIEMPQNALISEIDIRPINP
ncbi:MAG: SDR family NAD(P)-dependent oxidoreductase [Calditrichaeota bacterium]|nr:MAG: SDR family NAD(P)-dependent oxidoreductase [Calditrichota bacterium]MBL1205776.1 SDR family NAD(P)-dependent oxidoreductase [Calditrichota bacterium]NOG45604.1 SDR family NAD(P)-dependent oxidoreductase [Calditrichota bacterium]